MNLERDLEYSERSSRSKKILIAISIILAGLLIVSLIGIVKVKGERDILSQQLATIQKERETIQQKLAELGKENEALKHQVVSITEEKDTLAKEIATKKASLSKGSGKKTPASKPDSKVRR